MTHPCRSRKEPEVLWAGNRSDIERKLGRHFFMGSHSVNVILEETQLWLQKQMPMSYLIVSRPRLMY